MKEENKEDEEMVSMIPFGLLAGFAEFVECPKKCLGECLQARDVGSTDKGKASTDLGKSDTEKSCAGEIGVEKVTASEKEIRITGIEEEKFCFRLAEWKGDFQNSLKSFRLCFYEMEKRAYREIRITEFEICEVLKKEFWTEILVEVCVCFDRSVQSEFARAVQKLISQYDRYIRLKLECCDAEVSEALLGYPADLDEIHASSLKAQKKRWFESISGNGLTEKTKKDARERENLKIEDQFPEIALELDQPYLYKKYLSCSIEDFSNWYWKKNGLQDHRLALCRPARLYIGNAFCPLLFPDTEKLLRLLEKARAEKLGITIVTSYLREEARGFFESFLKEIKRWCEERDTETEMEKVEVVVNDWAVADLILAQIPNLIIPSLGVLLNKRRKDPRGRYLSAKGYDGYDRENAGENNLYADFYREFLKNEFKIERYEWESIAGLPDHRFPGEKNSLHLPFYQTNTSQYCTLYAGCVYGARGHQTLVRECPKYCNRFVYLYPEHLKMVGRGNSLFGFDAQILEALQVCEKESKWNKANYWRDLGIDRLVINLMEIGDEKIRSIR